jgi:hypothetical protein
MIDRLSPSLAPLEGEAARLRREARLLIDELERRFRRAARARSFLREHPILVLAGVALLLGLFAARRRVL